MNPHFEILKQNYPSTKVMIYDDAMVYYNLGKYQKQTEKELNELIQKLNLPLKAISNNSGGLFSDTVQVVEILK